MLKIIRIFPWVTGLAFIAYAALPQIYMAEMIDWKQLLTYTKYLVPVLLVGGGLSIISMIVHIFLSRNISAALTLLVVALSLTAGIAVLKMKEKAEMVPMIHDISTDVNDPPQFIALAGKRFRAANPDEYDTSQTAKQLEAYPEITTLVLDMPADQVFAAAQVALQNMGIEIVDANQQSMQIEGTATTKWFRFKDDVIIRIREAEGKTYVDMRSKSRVGRSDLGTNAKRIRRFFKVLETILAEH